MADTKKDTKHSDFMAELSAAIASKRSVGAPDDIPSVYLMIILIMSVVYFSLVPNTIGTTKKEDTMLLTNTLRLL